MREKDGYREQLEQILAYSGGKVVLTLKDVRGLTGVKDNRTLKKRYRFNNGVISASQLARDMLQGG